jgi:hypothetical protein
LGTHIAYILQYDLEKYTHALNIEKKKHKNGCKLSNSLNDGNSVQWEQNLGIINNYITNLYEFMPKIGNLSFVKSVAKWIANKIADKDHSKLFDNCKSYLPVLGNKVVNLRTKTIKERCFSHYFMYEITMNYIPGKKDT